MTFEEACMLANDLRREVTRTAERLAAGGWYQSAAVARGVTCDVECILDEVRREYGRTAQPSSVNQGEAK